MAEAPGMVETMVIQSGPFFTDFIVDGPLVSGDLTGIEVVNTTFDGVEPVDPLRAEGGDLVGTGMLNIGLGTKGTGAAIVPALVAAWASYSTEDLFYAAVPNIATPENYALLLSTYGEPGLRILLFEQGQLTRVSQLAVLHHVENATDPSLGFPTAVNLTAVGGGGSFSVTPEAVGFYPETGVSTSTDGGSTTTFAPATFPVDLAYTYSAGDVSVAGLVDERFEVGATNGVLAQVGCDSGQGMRVRSLGWTFQLTVPAVLTTVIDSRLQDTRRLFVRARNY